MSLCNYEFCTYDWGHNLLNSKKVEEKVQVFVHLDGCDEALVMKLEGVVHYFPGKIQKILQVGLVEIFQLSSREFHHTF